MTDLLKADMDQQVQLMVVFLSDGAPSDHCDLVCDHSIPVWTSVNGSSRKLQNCKSAAQCRRQLKDEIKSDCLSRISYLGDLLGRERIRLHTVAFGPPTDDYEVLQEMAAVLPRSSFQKLGLSASGLKSAFTSLTSTLTSLRTEGASGGSPLTRRFLQSVGHHQQKTDDIRPYRIYRDEWYMYEGDSLISKQVYDYASRCFVEVPMRNGSCGVAMKKKSFSHGAERQAFRCTEYASNRKQYINNGSVVTTGNWLVAKVTIHEHQLKDASFHKRTARMHAAAAKFAELFNGRVKRIVQSTSYKISFVSVHIYEVVDHQFGNKYGRARISIEDSLEGRFRKWNNNAGGVVIAKSPKVLSQLGVLGVICEDESDEDLDEDSDDDHAFSVEDIPQAFSHFSWSISNGDKLVCDLQGVWNSTDGFIMTDPVIHSAGRRHRNGSTDKGSEGIEIFFGTHVCSNVCKHLGLRQFRK